MVGGCVRRGVRRVRGSHTGTSTGAGWQDKIVGGKASGGIELPSYADADGFESVPDYSCAPGCPIAALDEMAGERKSQYSPGLKRHPGGGVIYGRDDGGQPKVGYQDTSSSVSRFFPNHDWRYEIAERLAGETPFRYCAKASRGEREAGCSEIKPSKRNEVYGDGFNTATKCDPELHTPEGVASRPEHHNTHPTLKPLSLTKWLAALCCPPPQFSPRLLIPFAGSGSEVIGAILSGGWAEIHAIEREQEYCEIAAARIAWWTKWSTLTTLTDPAEIRTLAQAAEATEQAAQDSGQLAMF